MQVTKAIIAAAGFGTRFIPATKNVPKELLNVINMPVLEYITEECVQSGITDIIIVTRHGNNSIEDYLDSSKELESVLEEKGKKDYLQKVQHAYKKANFIFVRQSADMPYGTATPLLVSKPLIGKDESFAYLYGDDIFLGHKPALKEMIESYTLNYSKVKGCLGGYIVPKKEISKYGVFKYKLDEGIKTFQNVIEKPNPDHIEDENPLARVGRFIYHADIFNYFDEKLVQNNPRGEYELTDIENKLIQDDKLMIQDISSEWLPVGDPANYLRSTIKIAMKNSEYRKIIEEEVLKK